MHWSPVFREKFAGTPVKNVALTYAGKRVRGALMLSPLVSWASGLPELGRRMWHWNVFRIPEEAPRTADERHPKAAVAAEPLLEAAE